jgi:hypothetical protein
MWYPSTLRGTITKEGVYSVFQGQIDNGMFFRFAR